MKQNCWGLNYYKVFLVLQKLLWSINRKVPEKLQLLAVRYINCVAIAVKIFIKNRFCCVYDAIYSVFVVKKMSPQRHKGN